MLIPPGVRFDISIIAKVAEQRSFAASAKTSLALSQQWQPVVPWAFRYSFGPREKGGFFLYLNDFLHFPTGVATRIGIAHNTAAPSDQSSHAPRVVVPKHSRYRAKSVLLLSIIFRDSCNTFFFINPRRP